MVSRGMKLCVSDPMCQNDWVMFSDTSYLLKTHEHTWQGGELSKDVHVLLLLAMSCLCLYLITWVEEQFSPVRVLEKLSFLKHIYLYFWNVISRDVLLNFFALNFTLFKSSNPTPFFHNNIMIFPYLFLTDHTIMCIL